MTTPGLRALIAGLATDKQGYRLVRWAAVEAAQHAAKTEQLGRSRPGPQPGGHRPGPQLRHQSDRPSTTADTVPSARACAVARNCRMTPRSSSPVRQNSRSSARTPRIGRA